MPVFRFDVHRKSGEVMLLMEIACGLKPIMVLSARNRLGRLPDVGQLTRNRIPHNFRHSLVGTRPRGFV